MESECLGQISYFLFYSSSGTAGIMPQLFSVRVHRHGPSRGFNVTTRSKGLPRFHFEQPTRLRFYVCCGPSHGRPNRYDGLLMSHSLYGSAQPTDQPTLRYTQPHGSKSSYESGHIQQHGSHPMGRVDSCVGASYRVGRSMGTVSFYGVS